MNANPAALAKSGFTSPSDGEDPPVVEKVKETLGLKTESQSGTGSVGGEGGRGTDPDTRNVEGK